MKAMQIRKSPEGPALHPAEVPQPKPANAEVLIRVHAAGVTPTDGKVVITLPAEGRT
jgi:NADPH:quinone reductase-like Zn-dependent oxidoreductase